MSGKILVAVSSLTGNTRILAHAIADSLPVAVYCEASRIPEDLSPFSAAVLCFWCDRGMAPEEICQLATRLNGMPIMCVATMGGDAQSEKARTWMQETSKALVGMGSGNTLAGIFVCRGRIDPLLFEKMTEMAGGIVTPERERTRKESETHPDRIDVLEAVNATRCALGMKE